MNRSFAIGSRTIGENSPVFIVAEMSANHLQDYHRALEIIHAAKEAGADAVKLQTYTADTITLDCDTPDFQINEGTVWTEPPSTGCTRRLILPGIGSRS